MMHKGKDWLLRLWNSTRIVWYLACIPYLIGIYACARRLSHVPDKVGNLHTFRTAGIALARGQNIYRSGTGDYIYPPLIAFLSQPLGWMSLHWAGVVMLTINAVVAIWTLKIISEELLVRLVGSAWPPMIARVAMLSAWLSLDHIRTELNEWETNIWMLLMFVLALKWADRRPILAGMALGFAFNIKYLPIVFIPYLIIRRRWKMLLAYAASILLFAFLPSISMGRAKDLAALAESYSGIARLLGVHAARAASANMNPFTSAKSISISSFLGRATGLPESHAMAISAGIAIVLLLYGGMLYRHNGLKIFNWPRAPGQTSPPFHALFAVEWLAIILFALMFSPYTNSAHLYLLVAINAGAAVLLIDGAPNLKRWPIWIGVLAMFFGTILPPGGALFRHGELLWKQFGICAWCMCLLFVTLLWSGLRHIRLTFAREKIHLPEDRDRQPM